MTTPITLCGFAVSNYCNKVKLSLPEKGIPFAEALAFSSQKEEMLGESPMGKVPFLRTAKGVLSESQVLTEFIDEFLPEAKACIKRIGERPQARKVNDDRLAAMDAFLAKAKK